MTDGIEMALVMAGMLGVPVALFLLGRVVMRHFKQPEAANNRFVGASAAATLAPVIVFLIHTRAITAVLVWVGILATLGLQKHFAKKP